MYANTAAEKLWGYAAGEMKGRAFLSLLTPPHRFDLSKVPAESAAVEPASMLVEAEGLRRDASTFALELRLQVAAGAPRWVPSWDGWRSSWDDARRETPCGIRRPRSGHA